MNANLPRAALPSGFRPLIALLMVAFLLRPLVADDAGSPSNSTGGTAGTSGRPVVSDRGTYPDESPVSVSQEDPFDPVRFNNESSTHYYNTRSSRLEPEYFFFPPDPPSLGTELRLFHPAGTGVPAPPELMAFVNAVFYPVLSTRLAADDLPRRLQLEIAAYRAARTELQNELRAKIAELISADAATQQQELASLARVQAPRIAELETAAARFRTDLLRGGFYGRLAGRGDWNENRSWHLTSKPDEKPPRDPLQMEFEVVRAAVFYQDGLSAAQRRLLREIAMELQAEIRHSDEPAQPPNSDSPFFFSPETARICVPADLPAELAGQIAAFVAEKNGVKGELREAIRNCDGAGADERTRVFGQLAARQAPRIAAIEELAENIRRGLARVPDMPGPPVPPRLPAELAARISAYRGHKLDLLKALHAIVAQPAPAARPGQKVVPAQEEVAAFNREHAAQFAELKIEKDGIREALAQHMRGEHPMQERKSIDNLLEEFENSRQRQELWEKYRDYQVAVLMPGLSPEQRRLLFDAAVEKLALPLPAGELPR